MIRVAVNQELLFLALGEPIIIPGDFRIILGERQFSRLPRRIFFEENEGKRVAHQLQSRTQKNLKSGDR